MGTYISEAEVRAELSDGEIDRLLDDDNDGTADSAPLTNVISRAESIFESYARNNYASLAALRATVTEAAKTFCLDLVRVRLYQRWPAQAPDNVDPLEFRKQVYSELRDLAMGRRRLDVDGTPEPQENQGGTVSSGTPDDTDEVDRVFGEGPTGTGDF